MDTLRQRLPSLCLTADLPNPGPSRQARKVGSVAMTGGSIRHSLIASSTFAAIFARLDHAAFAVGRGDLKILANNAVRYPDIIVFPRPADLDRDVVPNPIVVVEVVAPSTRIVDRFDKNVDYAAEPSIEHYLMLAEDERSAVLCSRTPQGWTSAELSLGEVVSLPAIGMELSFDDLYRHVTFGAAIP